MSDWLHNVRCLDGSGSFRLYVPCHGGNLRCCSVLVVGERARSFKAVSPGMLPPLGIIFGLLVGSYVCAGLER